MSNSDKEFEEWFKEQEERAIEEMGKMPELHDNYVLKNMCEAVWNKLYFYKERCKELEGLYKREMQWRESDKDRYCEKIQTLEAKVKELKALSPTIYLYMDRKIQTLEAKIKELEAQIAKHEQFEYENGSLVEFDKIQTLEALLIEACGELRHSNRYDFESGIEELEFGEPEKQRYEGFKKFLNKPEIKKLLEEVRSE